MKSYNLTTTHNTKHANSPKIFRNRSPGDQETQFFLPENPVGLWKTPCSQQLLARGAPKTGFLIYPLNAHNFSMYRVRLC